MIRASAATRRPDSIRQTASTADVVVIQPVPLGSLYVANSSDEDLQNVGFAFPAGHRSRAVAGTGSSTPPPPLGADVLRA